MADDKTNENMERRPQGRVSEIVVREGPDKFYFSSKRKYLALKREFERKTKKST